LKAFITFLQKHFSKLSRISKPLTKSVQSTNLKSVRIDNPIKSVGMKLFIIFFLCIVILVACTGGFSYTQSKGIITNKMADSTQQTINQAGEKLDLILGNFENMTYDILIDTEIMVI
jgi:methyl-accepting chemotaxis protein